MEATNNNVTPKFQIPAEENANEAHQGAIYGLQIRGKHMVTASADKTVRRWDLETGRLIPPVLTGYDSSVLCIQFDDRPEEDLIIAGSVQGLIAIFSFSSGDTKRTLPNAHSESVLSLHFDDRYLVTGGKDKSVRLCNRRKIMDLNSLPRFVRPEHERDGALKDTLEEYSLLTTLEIHQAAVNAIQIHGETIISGSGDGKLHLTNLQSGERLRTFDHARGVADLLFNGRLLLTGCSDNAAALYDLETQFERVRLTGHRNLIRAVDAIPGPESTFTRIATGSYDGTVRIWEKDLTANLQPWVVKSELEYGVQPEVISDTNPYIHHYVEGQRVFDVSLQDNKVFCSGQGTVVVGWRLPEC